MATLTLELLGLPGDATHVPFSQPAMIGCSVGFYVVAHRFRLAVGRSFGAPFDGTSKGCRPGVRSLKGT
jgi:hypothetical protein